jgi:TRAP-type C4-dicarboxylate transport system substrate-binding protein
MVGQSGLCIEAAEHVRPVVHELTDAKVSGAKQGEADRMKRSRLRAPGLRWLIALLVFTVACGNGATNGVDQAGDTETDTDPAETESDVDTSDIEPVDWQYASYLAPGSSLMDAISNYFDRLDEETGGNTAVEEFYQESLLSATDILGGVADGRAEVGFTIALYHPDRLPLSQVVGVPFVTEDAEAQVRTFNEMYQSNDAFREEWQSQGVHVLSFTPLTNSIVATTEPLEGLDDLRGRSIRSVGFLAGAMEAIGVNPVAMPAPEIFESLERGVIEGSSS